jgi:hypothetical protein
MGQEITLAEGDRSAYTVRETAIGPFLDCFMASPKEMMASINDKCTTKFMPQ